MKRCFYFHLIVILLRLAVVYRCPTLAMSFEKNYDIRTGIRNSFSQNDGAINFGACMLFNCSHLVIGQLLSKLHIDQSGGFWKVKSN